jgi:tRNA G18 (ribose-2'-O)-methylase SpoU
MRKLQNSELNRLSLEEFIKTEKIPCVVVLDNVRSLNNIGSVFRTSDAFVVEEIYLCGITATPPHRDIHKTALGATETVKWQYFDDTLVAVENLKEKGYKIFAIEQVDDSISLIDFEELPFEKMAIVFGHEINGVAESVVKIADASIEIPQHGTKHSLNISVCAGIVIWEVFKKSLKVEVIKDFEPKST